MIKLDGDEISPEELLLGLYVERNGRGGLTVISVHESGDKKQAVAFGGGMIWNIHELDLELYSLENCITKKSSERPKLADSEIVKIQYYVDIDKHGSGVIFPKGPFSDILDATVAYKDIVNGSPNERTVTLEKFTTTREVVRRSK